MAALSLPMRHKTRICSGHFEAVAAVSDEISLTFEIWLKILNTKLISTGTFGVVTSWTVKVYPDFDVVSYMSMTLAATGNVTVDMFVSRHYIQTSIKRLLSRH